MNDLLEWIKDNKAKVFALTIACFYLVVAFFLGGAELFSKVLLFLIFPVGFILFSEEVGGYTGILTRVPITKTSPGPLIAFMGWILLLLPLVGTIYIIIVSKK